MVRQYQWIAITQGEMVASLLTIGRLISVVDSGHLIQENTQ